HTRWPRDWSSDVCSSDLAGRVSLDQATAALQSAPVADLGYATVDLHRRQRCGFPEVIFCQGKTAAWVEGVVRQLAGAGQDCLAKIGRASCRERVATPGGA